VRAYLHLQCRSDPSEKKEGGKGKRKKRTSVFISSSPTTVHQPFLWRKREKKKGKIEKTISLVL